jgi:hypothetical protein
VAGGADVLRNALGAVSIAATLTLLFVSGCAGRLDAGRAPADPGPTRPAAGGTVLEVDPQYPEQPIVLDAIPDGLTLQSLRSDPPASEFSPYRAVLYGDPSLPDTLDGPVLLLGTSSGSASIGGPPLDRPGDRKVDVGNRPGWVVHDAARTWVGMPGDGEDIVQFVVGRGLDDDALVAAARGADFTSQTPTLAQGAVPASLEPLIASSPSDGPGGPNGEQIVLAGDSGTVVISAVRADARLSALWGFWTGDPVGTVIDGVPGSRGDMHGNWYGQDASAAIWAADGLVLSVVGLDDGVQFVDQVVQSLRRGSDAELEAMRSGAIGRAPIAEDIGCRAGTPIVSGVDGDLRWGLGLESGPAEGRWSSCMRLITLDGAPNGSYGTYDLPALGQLGVMAVSTGEAVATFGSYVLIGGVAPPGTARVAVTATDGRTVDAVLAEPGPRPGEKLFGAFLRGVPVVTNAQRMTVTAYDANATVLDTGP